MIPGFLSRVPSLEAEVSSWVESWPAKTREALSKRVFDADPDAVYPALLELYVHEILRNRFSEVLYEPTLQNTTHSPDFVARDAERSIMVECKVVFDEQRIRFSHRELRRLVNFLNRLQTDYGISVQPHGRLSAQVTPRRIEAFLNRELSKLGRPIELGHTLVFHDPPTGTFINFILMGPKDPDTNTVVSWWLTGDTAQHVTTHERIKAAVDEKATKYGRPDKPLCTRVSAVGIYSLRFGSPHEYEHRFAIFHNPHADYRLDPAIFPDIPQFVVQSSNEDGMTLAWHEERRPSWWKS